VEAAWKNIKQAVCKAQDNILGHGIIKNVRNGWYDEECKEILAVQNTEHLKMFKGKHEVILKPTGKQGKYVGGRKNAMKEKCGKKY
jgi:hypothetical protein